MPDLDQLAARARAGIAHDRPRRGGWSPATRALLAEMAQVLVDEGEPRRLAELAVTAWILTDRPLRECVESERVLGVWRSPAPARGRQGFMERVSGPS